MRNLPILNTYYATLVAFELLLKFKIRLKKINALSNKNKWCQKKQGPLIDCR